MIQAICGVKHACEFLQHIRSQQTRYDSKSVFAFHKYLDADGEVQLALSGGEPDDGYSLPAEYYSNPPKES